jgi:hypothetical protein
MIALRRSMGPVVAALSLAGFAAGVGSTEPQMPQPVLDAVRQKFPAAKVRGFEKKVEGGKTVFEVRLTVDVSADGKILGEPAANEADASSWLAKTLEAYEPRTSAPAPGAPPSVQVPNEHKPGALSGVVLPKLPGRPNGVTEIEAVLAVDQYKGIQHGRNGDHEIVEGHVTVINAIANEAALDTKNVELAMNVASSRDSNGLPAEIPVKPGDVMEVEGEYIPSTLAHGHNAQGPAAVVHFTHAPGGYVILPDGREYR